MWAGGVEGRGNRRGGRLRYEWAGLHEPQARGGGTSTERQGAAAR